MAKPVRWVKRKGEWWWYPPEGGRARWWGRGRAIDHIVAMDGSKEKKRHQKRRSLRGTQAQHGEIASRELGLARKALRSGDCAKALDHAVTARENARWGAGLFEKAEAEELVTDAHRCLRGSR